MAEFFSWGPKAPIIVEGELVKADRSGRDFKGNSCPYVEVKLTRPVVSTNRRGETKKFGPGDLIAFTASQKVLRDIIEDWDMEPGEHFRLIFTRTVHKEGREFGYKEFTLDSAHHSSKVQPGPTSTEPPF